MNWDIYRMERTRLIKEGVPFPSATEQAYEYMREEERKERETIGDLSPKNN